MVERMKIKWTNTYTKWSIASFCTFILSYSVYIDYSFNEKIAENKSGIHATDSLLHANFSLLDSLRTDSRVMTDSVSKRMSKIDSTLQKHINSIENTVKKQNSILYQISRTLNQ